MKKMKVLLTVLTLLAAVGLVSAEVALAFYFVKQQVRAKLGQLIYPRAEPAPGDE